MSDTLMLRSIAVPTPPLTPLDYQSPDLRRPLPWWMVTAAIFVYLACALLGLIGILALMSGAVAVGATLTAIAAMLAYLETDFIRDRDPDAAALLLLLDVPIMIFTALFGVILLGSFLTRRWETGSGWGAGILLSGSAMALFVLVTHLRWRRPISTADPNDAEPEYDRST